MALPLAYSMFERTADAERILGRFEFLTLDGNPGRYLEEAAVTRAGSTELVDRALPAIASDAGIPEAGFPRFVDTRFPALAAAQRTVPNAHEFSVRYSRQLTAVEEKFASLYDTPASGLSLAATPWLLLISGAACLVSGLIALRSRGRAALMTILGLGVALAVGPLALGAPQKAADGEDVKDFASRGLTPRAATAARRASAALDALVEETSDRTLPTMAGRQAVTETELRRRFSHDYPAAERLLGEWDEIGPRLARLSRAVSASVADFESAKKMPMSGPVWLLLGGGVAMGLSAGLALLRSPQP